MAGPLHASSTAQVTRRLTHLGGADVTGASSFDSDVDIGTLSIFDTPDAVSPAITMTNVINDGSLLIQGGFNSQVYLGESFLALSGDLVRVTAPLLVGPTTADTGLSIGTTSVESSLVVAGNRASYPSVASVSAGLYSGVCASLALTSGAGAASWIDFMTTGATSMQARIQYSSSSLNFQHILSGAERMRLTQTSGLP